MSDFILFFKKIFSYSWQSIPISILEGMGRVHVQSGDRSRENDRGMDARAGGAVSRRAVHTNRGIECAPLRESTDTFHNPGAGPGRDDLKLSSVRVPGEQPQDSERRA